MSKSTQSYWNTLAEINANKWQPIEDTGGYIEELALAMDEQSGDYTRLTRFKKGANTQEFGGKSHDYPEEIYIISGNRGQWKSGTVEIGDSILFVQIGDSKSGTVYFLCKSGTVYSFIIFISPHHYILQKNIN